MRLTPLFFQTDGVQPNDFFFIFGLTVTVVHKRFSACIKLDSILHKIKRYLENLHIAK